MLLHLGDLLDIGSLEIVPVAVLDKDWVVAASHPRPVVAFPVDPMNSKMINRESFCLCNWTLTPGGGR